MDAIGRLTLFAYEAEGMGAPLAPLMRDTRKRPPPLVTDTITGGVDLRQAVDTRRLRSVWNAEKDRPGAKLSQKAMALEWGVDPSNVSQYLNGHLKLNTEAKLRFATYLKKPVLEIWPDFEFASVAPGDLPPESVAVAAMWTGLPGSSRKVVVDLLRSLSGLQNVN